jgi:signal transduction histidine kinase
MLARLRIRQKLNLLLVLPLIAVVITTVPIVVERVDAAGASAATARAAVDAREVGGLIQDLQQERLLSLGFLATGKLDSGTLVAAVQAVTDDTARLDADAGTRAEVSAAGAALAALDDVRRRILDRSANVSDVYGVYQRAIGALLDALRLSDRPGVDVSGLGRLAALDALMRANEEASSIGGALVAMVADQSAGGAGGAGKGSTIAPQLAAAVAGLDQQDQRFHRLGERAQVDLIDLVEHGQAGVRLRRLADNPDTADVPPGPARAAAALTIAVSYTDLRVIAQDRVIRDIATAAQSRAAGAQAAAVGVGIGGLLLFVLVVALSTVVSRSISQPLRRLSRAAGQVADLADLELTRVGDSDEAEAAPPRLSAVEVGGADEVGELARAFNRVQATAARMLERQVSSRRNVAVMFANIARRTQTLVGRQLLLIDELEQTEQDAEMMERLYRLDHVATRLRRSADALLVVSGTRDESADETPVALTDVVRSAVAEIEGYRGVRLRAIAPVSVDVELVGDLRLLLAELLENATSFSPPATLVEVTAELDDVEDCVVSIVDHGIGMTSLQMVQENRRLVDRERLDVAPTTVLGLFVVGRLARRHGLGVRLGPTPGQGVTATVKVPKRLLARGGVPTAPASLGGGVGTAGRPEALSRPPQMLDGPRRPLGTLAAALTRPPDQFPWFAKQHGRRPAVELPAGPAPSPVPPAPAAPVPEAPVTPPVAPVPAAPVPAAPQAGGPGEWPPPAPGAAPVHGGLVRRTPGQHLSEMAEPPSPSRGLWDVQAPRRDAEAEREELDDFIDGLARARPTPPPNTGPSTGEPR